MPLLPFQDTWKIWGQYYFQFNQILSINSAFTKILGYKKSDVIRKNISLILPSPFSELHDMLLRKYLETGYGKVIDRSRKGK
jgi:two-component system sensor kinase FixL